MPAKVKTFSELAKEYGVCRNTLRKWIQPIEKELKLSRRALREWQVKKIYVFLDEP
jgi:transposase-like protein